MIVWVTSLVRNSLVWIIQTDRQIENLGLEKRHFRLRVSSFSSCFCFCCCLHGLLFVNVCGGGGGHRDEGVYRLEQLHLYVHGFYISTWLLWWRLWLVLLGQKWMKRLIRLYTSSCDYRWALGSEGDNGVMRIVFRGRWGWSLCWRVFGLTSLVNSDLLLFLHSMSPISLLSVLFESVCTCCEVNRSKYVLPIRQDVRDTYISTYASWERTFSSISKTV